MNFAPPTVDEIYREYADLTWRYHALEGRDATDAETERLEAAMDAVWTRLDYPQQLSLRGMSSDLNWLRRLGALPPKGRPALEVTEEDTAALHAAQVAQDWHVTLHWLRVCAAVVSPVSLAVSRAVCYRELGFPAIAEANDDLAVSLASGRNLAARKALSGELLWPAVASIPK